MAEGLGLVREGTQPGDFLSEDDPLPEYEPEKPTSITGFFLRLGKEILASNRASDRQRYYQQFMAQEFWQCRQYGLWEGGLYSHPDPNQDGIFYQCDYFSDKIRAKLAQWVATAIDITVYSGEESAEGSAGARAGHTVANYYMNRFNTPIEEQIVGLQAILQGTYMFETYYDPMYSNGTFQLPNYQMQEQPGNQSFECLNPQCQMAGPASMAQPMGNGALACPSCQQPAQVYGPASMPMLGMDGSQTYNRGDVVSRHIDPLELGLDPMGRAAQPETMGYIYRRRRLPGSLLDTIYKQKVPRVKADYALRYQQILQKQIGAFSGGQGSYTGYGGSEDEDDNTTLEQVWIEPFRYSNVVAGRAERLRNGITIEEGQPYTEVFSEGACVSLCGNKLVDLYPENKNKRFSGGVYWLVPSAPFGLGNVGALWQARLINDSYNMMVEALRYISAPVRLFKAGIIENPFYGNFNRQVPVYNSDTLEDLVKYVDPPNVSQVLPQFLDRAASDMDRITSSTESMMATMQAAGKGDGATDFMKEVIVQQAGLPGVIKGYCYSRRAQQIIDEFKTYCINPVKVSTKVMGDYSRYEIQELSGMDIRAELFVSFEENSAVPRSPNDRQKNFIKAMEAGIDNPELKPERRKQLAEVFQVPYTGDEGGTQRRKFQIRQKEIFNALDRVLEMAQMNPQLAPQLMQPDPLIMMQFQIQAPALVGEVLRDPMCLIEKEFDDHDIFLEEIGAFMNSDKGIYADPIVKQIMLVRFYEHRMARSEVQQSVSAEAAMAQLPQLQMAQQMGQGMGGTALPVKHNVMPQGQLTPQPKEQSNVG